MSDRSTSCLLPKRQVARKKGVKRKEEKNAVEKGFALLRKGEEEDPEGNSRERKFQGKLLAAPVEKKREYRGGKSAV